MNEGMRPHPLLLPDVPEQHFFDERMKILDATAENVILFISPDLIKDEARLREIEERLPKNVTVVVEATPDLSMRPAHLAIMERNSLALAQLIASLPQDLLLTEHAIPMPPSDLPECPKCPVEPFIFRDPRENIRGLPRSRKQLKQMTRSKR